MSRAVRLSGRTQSGVPPVRLGILLIVLNRRSISGLQILQSSRLNLDQAGIVTSRNLGLVRGSLAGASAVDGHIERDAMKTG